MGRCLLLTLAAAWGTMAYDAPSPEADAEMRADAAPALRELGAAACADEAFPDRIAPVSYQLEGRPPPAFWRLLERRPDLEELDLINSGVRDEDLAHLRGLKNLRTLWLTYTDISDAGLARLRDAPRLVKVYCDNSRVSRAGVRRLKKSRPTIGVFW